jgi:SPP1 gp7 family putative phage head morphogenesis protein
LTIKKIKLSEKKERWARNRNVVLRGKRLNYNASIQIEYNKKLQKLINQMTREVNYKITKLFMRLPVTPLGAMDDSIGSQARILMNKLMDKFDKLFALEAQTLASHMLERTLKSSENNLKISLKELSGGLTIKTSIVPPELTDVITASIADNVVLIQSIPEQYFKDITGVVMRSITTGQGMYDLLPEIKKYGQITERRAELLALDQSRKAYTSVNVTKLNKLGVKKFEWLHSGGGQTPRESHLNILDGKVFSFENLENEQIALGVPKADRGLPGYPVNCRCTLVPVIEFGDEDD